jgi:hypothetical protein
VDATNNSEEPRGRNIYYVYPGGLVYLVMGKSLRIGNLSRDKIESEPDLQNRANVVAHLYSLPITE